MAANTTKRGPKIGDAASLWNFTPSPGWDKDEVQILKLCLMKFGIGQWLQIVNCGLLPGKMIQQLNGQTQRLLGQQSLAAFTGLHVDIDRIRQDNAARKDVQRKSGLIIWSGANATKAMKTQWRVEAQEKYGLTPEQIQDAEAQLEEIASSRAVTAEPVVSLMDACPQEMSREERLALLRRLYPVLVSLLSRCKCKPGTGEAMEVDVAEPAAATTDASPDDFKENVPAATANAGWATMVAARNKPAAKPAAAKGRPPKVAAAPKVKAAKVAAKPSKAAALSTTQDGGVKKRSGAGVRALEAAKAMGEGDAGVVSATHQADMAVLVAMGFTTAKAKEALVECSNDMERAVEWLFENCV